MRPEALRALKDISGLLPGPVHPPGKYEHAKVSVKMINRPQFHEMSGPAQEVYVYRLAK